MQLIPRKGGTVQEQDQVTTGVVVNANERGFQLQGMETWLNWSKFAPEPRTFPAPGHHIVASLDKAGFVRKVVIGTGKGAKRAVTSDSPYDLAAARREAERLPVEPTTGRGIVAARNPQLDREFRLRCLHEAMGSQQWLQTSLADIYAAFVLAEQIAAWAEGKSE